MPRPLGVLLIAAASCLGGVFAWFCLVWLVAAAANLTRAPMLGIAMLILAPHVAGWLIALGLGAVIFVLGFRCARNRRLAWLGFAHAAASITTGRDGSGPADGAD